MLLMSRYAHCRRLMPRHLMPLSFFRLMSPPLLMPPRHAIFFFFFRHDDTPCLPRRQATPMPDICLFFRVRAFQMGRFA